MAYLKRWRKCKAEVLALAEANSSDNDEASVLVGASVAPSVHERGDTDSSGHVDCRDNGNTQDSNYDSSDTNYQESDNSDNLISSSSGSENVSDDDGEELDIGKDFADWAIRNACTRTAFQEVIGILRRHWNRVPKDARTLLHISRHVQLQDKCGG